MLIALNGFKKSGKGALGRLLGAYAQKGPAKEVQFSEPLKVLTGRIFGIDLPEGGLYDFVDTDFKDSAVLDVAWDHRLDHRGTHLTGRQILQNLGHGARETFGDSFWVDQALPPHEDDFRRKYGGFQHVIVTDLRYPNEAQRVIDLGGYVIEIIRPGIESDGHHTEQPLPRNLVHGTVKNDGNLDDLAGKALEIVQELGL